MSTSVRQEVVLKAEDLVKHYPIKAGVAVNATIASYGKLNPDSLPLSKIAENRKTASTLVDKVGFDN